MRSRRVSNRTALEQVFVSSMFGEHRQVGDTHRAGRTNPPDVFLGIGGCRSRISDRAYSDPEQTRRGSNNGGEEKCILYMSLCVSMEIFYMGQAFGQKLERSFWPTTHQN
jgi:hypothetical protein